MVDKRSIAREKKTLPDFLVTDRMVDLKEIATRQDIDALIAAAKGTAVPKETLVRLYLAYNIEYASMIDMRPFLQIGLLEHVPSQYVLDEMIRETKTYKESIEKRIADLQKEVSAYDQVIQIKPAHAVQPFVVEEVLVEYVLRIPYDVFYLFDRLELSENACFAKLNDYVKVWNGTDEVQDKEHWFTVPIENQIQIRIVRNPNTKNEMERYATILVSSNTIQVMTALRATDESYIETMWNIIRALFPTVPLIASRSFEKDFKGYYLVPQQAFNQFVFSDVILFDPVLSSFVVSNEISTPSRKTNSVHAVLRLPEKEDIRVIFEGKVAVQEDVYTRTQNRDLFPINSPYVLVRLQKVKKEEIEPSASFLNRVLAMYDTRKETVERLYRAYIPTFDTTIKVKEVKEKGKYGKAKDIFIPKYPRFVGVDYIPTVLKDDEEKKEWEEKGYQVMKFPREEPGREEYYYIACTKNENRYPGVKVNSLPNKDQYPVLPKCFSTDQRKKPVYINYFKKGVVNVQEKVKTEQQRIISTGKFLPLGGIAYLPDSIDHFLQLASVYDPHLEYRRKGAYTYDTTDPISKYSLLATVLDVQKDIVIGSKEALNRVRQTILQEYERLKGLTASYGVPELKDNAYMDPRVYRRFLGHVYNKTIVVFTKNAENPDGAFLVDKHDYVLLKEAYKERASTVLVFEHTGAERDYAVYPMCELILASRDNKLIRTIDPDVTTSIVNSYNFVTTFYRASRMVKAIANETLPPLLTSTLKDMAGNIRGLVVQDKFTLFCDPIAIFRPIRTSGPFDVKSVAFSDALALIEMLDGTPTGYAENTTNSAESNVYFTLPGYDRIEFVVVTTLDKKYLPSLGLIQRNVYQVQIPLIEQYMFNKRYARRLLHLFLKRYVTRYPKSEWNETTLRAFANDHIIVGSDYPRIFFDSPELPDIDEIPILSIGTQAIKDGVTYTALAILTNRSQLLDSIASYPFLYQYYLDLTDFRESRMWYLVSSYEMYLRTIALHNTFALHTGLKIGATEPYNALLPLGKNGRMIQARVVPMDEIVYTEYLYIYNGPHDVEQYRLARFEDGLSTLLYKKDGVTRACRITPF